MLGRQIAQLEDRGLKLVGQHVIGEVAKPLGMKSRVRRTLAWWRATPPPKRFEPMVLDAVSWQFRGKTTTAKVREFSRARKPPHVGDRLDAVLTQQPHKPLQRMI